MNENTMVYITVVLGILLAVSEGLALLPFLKSNSILQLIINILKFLTGKKS